MMVKMTDVIQRLCEIQKQKSKHKSDPNVEEILRLSKLGSQLDSKNFFNFRIGDLC